MVILIPPLFGGRRIHDTEASYSHGVEPPWILPKEWRLCKNQSSSFVIPTKVGIQFMFARYGSPLSQG